MRRGGQYKPQTSPSPSLPTPPHQEIAPYVRVLGSFPMDTDIGGTNVEAMFASMRSVEGDEA